MNASVSDFEVQWKFLQDAKQEIALQINQLVQILNNLTSDPGMQMLTRDGLIEQAKEYQALIHAHRFVINRRLLFIKQRTMALTDRRVKKHMDVCLAKSKKRLRVLIAGSESNIVIQKEKDLIWQIDGPIADVERFLRFKNQQSKLDAMVAEGLLQITLEKIKSIDEFYQQAKKSLNDLIFKARDKKELSCKAILEWATCDKDHLLWVIDKERSSEDEVIRFYKNRWPNDNLTDVPCKKVASFNSMPDKPKATRKRVSKLPEIDSGQVIVDCPKPWEFFLVSGALGDGKILPTEREEFLREVRLFLPNSVAGLDIGTLYDKLTGLTRLNLHQRQLLTKIVGDQFHGWQRLRIRKYRVLIFIDEDRHQIRFFPFKKDNEPYYR